MNISWIMNMFNFFKNCLSGKSGQDSANRIEIKNSTVILIGDIKKY